MRTHIKPTAIFLTLMILLTMLVPVSFSATEVPTASAGDPAAILLGDADLDGEVDISDVTIIQRFLAEITDLSDEAQTAADVDGDGDVTISDATAIQRWIADIEIPYAIGEPIETTPDPTEAPTEAETAAPTEAELTGDEWKENTGSIVLSDSGITVTGDGAYVVGNIVFITEGGDWEVTGTCSDGMIYVYTGDEKDINDKVKLRLNGMSLTNTTGPAIYFDRCKKSFITLESGSVNTLTDGTTYAAATDYTVNGTTYTVDCSAAKGALNSDDTLEIKGKGTLVVNGCYKHGVSSSDDISIENGVFQITSVKDAFHANDDITVNGKNVEITIDSQSDGFDSEGTLNLTLLKTADITAVGKGIKADLDIVIDAGAYTVDTADDCINGNATVTVNGGAFDLESDDEAITAVTGITIEDGDFTLTTAGKGVKSDADLVINGGTFTINSTDDSIHCNANVTIGGGDFTLTSGDDGIHADTTLTIEDGAITITKSYEGLEGNDVIINGGTVKLTASDDGINAAGGQDQSSQGGRPGWNPFQPSSSSNSSITVNGGYIFVTASGDGIDSNGALSFNGGTVIVQGPTSGGNSPVDADGTVGFNGGTVIALASSNAMWEDLNGKLGSAVYNKNIGSVTKGSVICVTDSSGNLLSALSSELSGSLGVVYYTDRTSSNASVKFIRGGSYSGTLDDFGYSESGSVSGGTSYSGSASSGGGTRPGGRW